MGLIDVIKDILFDDDNRIVTQPPIWKLPQKSLKIMYLHIVIALAICALQHYYEAIGNGAPEEIPIWMMATANLMISVFGSVRFFDVVVVAELIVALTIIFICQWLLFLPVIFVMLYQAIRRLEFSIEIGETSTEQRDQVKGKMHSQ